MVDLNELAEKSRIITEKRLKNGANLNTPLRHASIKIIEATEAKSH